MTNGLIIGHDARCEYAKDPECNCLCEGKYHQIGWRMEGTILPFLREKYVCIKANCFNEVGPTELYCEEHKRK